MSVSVEVDPNLGGRWTSLRDADGHEWLWTRREPRRNEVRRGSAFVDAGGVEECFPTIAGHPDHGDAWSQAWSRTGPTSLRFDGDDASLSRSVTIGKDSVLVDYALDAPGGYPFIWAFHALIRPSQNLRINVPEGEGMLTWPQGYEAPARITSWPHAEPISNFGDLSTDDGTACFALLPDRRTIVVTQQNHWLAFELEVMDQPACIGLWRNLKGYAWDGSAPYRSVGVEPMIGKHPHASRASSADLARVPDSGRLEWSLRLTLGKGQEGPEC